MLLTALPGATHFRVLWPHLQSHAKLFRTWRCPGDAWRYAHCHYERVPYNKLVGAFPSLMDFDHTLGFPGEEPCVMPGSLSWICGACGCVGSSSHCLLVGLALTSTRVVFLAGLVCAAWLFFGFTWTCTLGVARTKPPLLIWILLGFLGVSQEVGAVSHGNLCPRNSVDNQRGLARGDGTLASGRPVLGITKASREKLLSIFADWLEKEGVGLDALVGPGEPDIDLVNIMLERYGRDLYRSGRPYGHYAETVNAGRDCAGYCSQHGTLLTPGCSRNHHHIMWRYPGSSCCLC